MGANLTKQVRARRIIAALRCDCEAYGFTHFHFREPRSGTLSFNAARYMYTKSGSAADLRRFLVRHTQHKDSELTELLKALFVVEHETEAFYRDLNGKINGGAQYCLVCYNKPRDTVYTPCGHFVSCATCANKMGPRCPMCRRVYASRIKVYTA